MAKKIFFIPMLILVSFIFTACGDSNATPTAEPLDVIYTSVAKTIMAAPTLPAATGTPLPAPTLNLGLTPTAAQAVTSTPGAVVQATSAGGTCTSGDNGAYVSDVTVSDGTYIYPGQVFTKTWLVQNTGNCTWGSNYELVFVSGNQMSGATSYLKIPVDPGKQLQVSVALTAPTTEGTYTGYWKLANEKGSVFGSSLTVKIVSSTSAGTLTPTVTTTPPTSTPTTAYTATTQSTSTPAPSSTPTIGS